MADKASKTEDAVVDFDSIMSEANEPDELTPEQLRIQELEAQMKQMMEALKQSQAAQRAEALDDTELVFDEEATGEDVIHVHILQDGFMAAGTLWYRGQEIRVSRSSQAFEDTLDRNGKSWLDLTAAEQYDKYGYQAFAEGPWLGKKWGDVNSIHDPEERAAAQKAAKQEQARAGALPRLDRR